MMLTSGAGRGGGRRWLAPSAALIAASVVTLAGCSSGSSSGSSGGGSGSGSATPAGVTKASQEVASLSATTSSYPVPTAAVSGVSKFTGRTVYYLPLVQQIPGFVVTAQTMKVALAKAGLKLQVCDGQGQPSAMAACVQQAAGAKAAGIVTDAIPLRHGVTRVPAGRPCRTTKRSESSRPRSWRLAQASLVIIRRGFRRWRRHERAPWRDAAGPGIRAGTSCQRRRGSIPAAPG